MGIRDWIIAFVFIALHLAAAVIRGVPIQVIIFGTLGMVIAVMVISLSRGKRLNSNNQNDN
jgi:uncharacterized protein YacL